MEKKKILIIDDEKDFAKMVKLNLEQTGEYEVKMEHKGLDGLRTVRTFKPDLILLDVIMPDMAGSDVARKLKDQENTKDIPIVFVTATVMKEEAKSRGGLVGGHPFIAKPATIQEIITVIEKNIK